MFVIFVFHQRGTLNGNFLHVKLNSTWYNNNYCTIIEKMKFCLFYTFCVLLNLNFPEREKKKKWTVAIGMVCTVKSRPKTSQSACSIQPENCLPYNHGLFPPFPPPPPPSLGDPWSLPHLPPPPPTQPPSKVGP